MRYLHHDHHNAPSDPPPKPAAISALTCGCTLLLAGFLFSVGLVLGGILTEYVGRRVGFGISAAVVSSLTNKITSDDPYVRHGQLKTKMVAGSTKRFI